MTAPVPERSLEELAARARDGDAASFEQLVARMRAPLVAFLARRLGAPEDADDVAQDTFDRAYRHLSSYDPGRKFTTWLFAIGKNVASNHRVARQRRARHEQRAALETEVGNEGRSEPVQAGEMGETWKRAHRVLGTQAYRALWLRYACDFSVREIARELGKTVVGTKVMLFRARAKLLEEDS
jgi:RNA polymerase sigma-70 factor (ECF subfamily)